MPGKENAAEAWQGNDGRANETQPLSEGTDPMKTTEPIIPAATVTTTAGFVVQPDSLLMKSLCNGDNPASVIDRSRFFVTVGA